MQHNHKIERDGQMAVEDSWNDVYCYDVSFKNNNANTLENIVHRFIVVPEEWNEETIKLYFMKAFKNITVIKIEYLSDAWFPGKI